ncbi:MAG: hypothetical protein LBT42_08140 [Tannerella sp.]|jgi:hypothetical protein|nr:hypothetical protein [Tannerella sp.]
MKNRILIAVFTVLSMAGCADGRGLDDPDAATGGVSILISAVDKDGRKIDERIRNADIESYDVSTNILHLKKSAGYVKDIETGSFRVCVGNEEIYAGTFPPMYLSTFPAGAYIRSMPAFYPDYMLAIEYLNAPAEDPRADPRIVNALKSHGQYRGGLVCEIISVRFLDNDRVAFQFELTNGAPFNYNHLDPDKTGLGLFHYFTNGLMLQGETAPHNFYCNIQAVSPESWNTWDKSWLSVIKKGETKKYTFIYDAFGPLPSGGYRAWFSFPGLSHVEQKDLNQSDGLIWIGNTSASMIVDK